MRAGRDPRRRNRNIGTAKQGHGQNNRMTIPEAWADGRMYYERLKEPVILVRGVWAHSIAFLVEPTHRGCVHACTVDDVVRMLEYLPQAHVIAIKTVVLRQPTRKQGILNPCWGRLVYWANIGRYSGTTIFLEAQEPDGGLRWNKSLDPAGTAELERLRVDGHRITETKRDYLIESSLNAIRATQLYRTVPHELGHYADYLASVREPGRETADLDEKARLERAYASKPHQDKEAFAHRYADEVRRQLIRERRIPFPRREERLRVGADGLTRAWFGSVP